MKTIISWISASDELPPLDEEESDEDQKCSVVVLGTDGTFIEEVFYVFKSPNRNAPHDWVVAEYGWGYFMDVTHWCDLDSFELPGGKPKEKTYTLRQLRQAWGKGFSDGKKSFV